MTVVVSDTSPLNYLILINAVELLPRLFSQVFIPFAVAEELSHPKTPEVVRAWLQTPPEWLQIRALRVTSHSFDLHKGEAHAILLAKELGVLSLLIDERKGFHVAEALGLEPIGLLGVLELCATRHWIDFDEHIQRLHTTSFRFNQRLIVGIRKRLASASATGD